ncbi:MAG TPA: type II and III secretion system protein [Pirellulales bacterium]|jgi:hypothetical protein|nr:type II and III secretion system protein [Pirellulales bacterium]
MLTIGPPPRLYSPSADYSARIESAPGWAVVGDANGYSHTDVHPLPNMPEFNVAYGAPQSVFSAAQPGYAAAAIPPAPHFSPSGYGDYAFAGPPSVPVYAPTPVYYAPAYPPTAAYVPSSIGSAYPGAVCPTPISSTPTACDADRLDHLLQAAHHLDAAGMHLEADQLRSQCNAEIKSVVEQLQTAQAELARLHQTAYNQPTASTATHSYNLEEWTPQPTTSWKAAQKQTAATSSSQQEVSVHVKIMELNRTKCHALGFDFSKFDGEHFVANHGFECCDSDSAFLNFLDVLQKEGLLSVVSAPQIQTRNGQQAHVEIGQEVPVLTPHADNQVTIDYKKIGTTVDVLPEILDSHKLRLQLRPAFSQLEQFPANETGELKRPVVSTTEISTTLEMKSGQTAVLGGLIIKREYQTACQSQDCVSQACHEGACASSCSAKDSDDVEVLVLVHAEILDAESTTKTVDVPEHPVVTAAVSAPKNHSQQSYTVTPAAYFEPAASFGPQANRAALSDFLFPQALPEPFALQPIAIESIGVEPGAAFTSPVETWSLESEPAPFTAEPIMVDRWLLTPDKR